MISRTNLAVLLTLSAVAGVYANWPAFRGDGLGVSPATGFPDKWSKDDVVWHAPLPGPGASSPIVWGDRVFVTSYSGYGVEKDKGALKDLTRHLVCLERKTGKFLWQKGLPAIQREVEYEGHIHEHGYASSTPVTDGERVFTFFGRSGVYAFDFAGKQLWHTEVGTDVNSWGSGGSPILLGNLLLVNATIESGSLIALDKTSGKEVWRSEKMTGCWSTPIVVKTASGKQEVVIHIQGYLVGIDPTNGKQLWECETIGADHTGSSPIVHNDILYVMGAGFEGRWFQAIRSGGKGDVTKTHVVWSRRKAGSNYCSPLLVDDRLYFASGLFGCLEAKTGKVLFQERLPGLGREYSSPVLVGGKIFLCARDGSIHVLAPKASLESLSRFKLEGADSFFASPAVSQGQVFVRSGAQLFCLGKK